MGAGVVWSLNRGKKYKLKNSSRTPVDFLQLKKTLTLNLIVLIALACVMSKRLSIASLYIASLVSKPFDHFVLSLFFFSLICSPNSFPTLC